AGKKPVKKGAGKKAGKKAASATKASKRNGAARTKTVATRSRPQAVPVARALPKAQASSRLVARSNTACREHCLVCGNVCVRGGLQERHRCGDHAGMSM